MKNKNKNVNLYCCDMPKKEKKYFSDNQNAPNQTTLEAMEDAESGNNLCGLFDNLKDFVKALDTD